MFFYSIQGNFEKENTDENEKQKSKLRRRRSKFRVKDDDEMEMVRRINEYNMKNGKDCFYFLCRLGSNGFTFGFLSESEQLSENMAECFLKRMGIEAESIDIEETTFGYIEEMLSSADMFGYIEDYYDVFNRFGIERVSGRNRRCKLDYDETMLLPAGSKENIYKRVAEIMSEETFVPELDRIYSGKAKTKVSGHPVHYMIETDGWNERKEMYMCLLQALYDNGRIKNRRFSYFEFDRVERISSITLEQHYKCNGGGAVVIKIAGNESEENDVAGSETSVITTICETMVKYRNQVLTILCLPRVCEKTKKIIMENLGSISIMEIKEDLADYNKASDYLKLRAKKEHLRPDKALFVELEENKQYFPDELINMFDDWRDRKMRTTVFPQYSEMEACQAKAVKEKPNGNAYEELDGMIGLRDAKAVIKKALAYYKIQKIYKDKGIKQDRPAMHMVFTGSPGTAKTSVARLFARIMKENGLLASGKMIEVGRSELVGKYVGWTAAIVKEKFQAAKGGVLFIDEAYSLVDDRGGSFGDEAINTIVQEMENHRDEVVVIFAGYTNEMERFLEKNPGLRSRIAFHVPFADYDTDELCEIAKLIGKTKGVELTERALDKLSTVFEVAKTQPDFGNGRYVRNVIELSKMNQANRITNMDVEKITEKVLTTIEEEDIEIPKIKNNKVKRTIGFVS